MFCLVDKIESVTRVPALWGARSPDPAEPGCRSGLRLAALAVLVARAALAALRGRRLSRADSRGCDAPDL